MSKPNLSYDGPLEDLPTWLQKNHYDKYFFGLGFIQVKVTEELRFHFYHPELAAITPKEEVHDHRYSFSSTILKGRLQMSVFQIGQTPINKTSSYISRTVSCDPKNPAPDQRVGCELEPSISMLLSAGSHYLISHDTYHKVMVLEPTVTRLERQLPITKEFARVLTPRHSKEACPFEPKMEDEELWDWVKKIVNQ